MTKNVASDLSESYPLSERFFFNHNYKIINCILKEE